jgi:cytidine deaminase
VSSLHGTGGGRLVAVSAVAGDGTPLAPCGRCRQLLHEAGGPALLVDTPGLPVTIDSLLPGAFVPSDIAEHGNARRP